MKDHNLLLDKLHTSASDSVDAETLSQQVQTLKGKNAQERHRVDQIFTERNL